MRPAAFPLAALLLLGLASMTPLAQAWVAGPDRPHHADLAVEAAKRLPEPHRSLVLAHEDAFRRGALDPDGITNPDAEVHTFFHAFEAHDGGGGGVWQVEKTWYEAVMALRGAKDPEAAAYRLGILTHFTMDLAMPFHTGRDAYDDERHERFEHLAYDHRHEYAVGPTREPQALDDVREAAGALAADSARLWDPLARAIEREEWNAEAARLMGEATTLGIERTGDFLLTAFTAADPARPAPVATHEESLPVPREPEDAGVTLDALRKMHPWPLVALVLAMCAAGIALRVAGTSRKERPNRR